MGATHSAPPRGSGESRRRLELYLSERQLLLPPELVRELAGRLRRGALAPLFSTEGEGDECPICFHTFPSVNTSACCRQLICTGCWVQLQARAQPAGAAACPFCKEAQHRVQHLGPRSAEALAAEQAAADAVQRARLREQQAQLLREQQRAFAALQERRQGQQAARGHGQQTPAPLGARLKRPGGGGGGSGSSGGSGERPGAAASASDEAADDLPARSRADQAGGGWAAQRQEQQGESAASSWWAPPSWLLPSSSRPPPPPPQQQQQPPAAGSAGDGAAAAPPLSALPSVQPPAAAGADRPDDALAQVEAVQAVEAAELEAAIQEVMAALSQAQGAQPLQRREPPGSSGDSSGGGLVPTATRVSLGLPVQHWPQQPAPPPPPAAARVAPEVATAYVPGELAGLGLTLEELNQLMLEQALLESAQSTLHRSHVQQQQQQHPSCSSSAAAAQAAPSAPQLQLLGVGSRLLPAAAGAPQSSAAAQARS